MIIIRILIHILHLLNTKKKVRVPAIKSSLDKRQAPEKEGNHPHLYPLAKREEPSPLILPSNKYLLSKLYLALAKNEFMASSRVYPLLVIPTTEPPFRSVTSEEGKSFL